MSLVDYNPKEHFNAIENFNCGDTQMNELLKEINSHHCTTKLLMYNDEIIAYIAYRCHSIKLLENDDDEVFPAIEIHGFAVSKKYQSKKLSNKLTISHNFLIMMLKNFKDISNNIIKANYIVLHSVPKAVNFYKKVGFQRTENHEVLNDSFNDDCIPMIMKLE